MALDKMKDRKRSSRSYVVATLATMSMLTIAISAQQQHQSIFDEANNNELSSNSSSESSHVHRHLTPRRRPSNVDRTKRMNALPPLITQTGNLMNVQQPTAPYTNHHQRRSPYYPSVETSTCLNDNNYPDYYLYDVKSYFFLDPQECCERHFGRSVRRKGGGMLKDGGADHCLAAISGEMISLMSTGMLKGHPGPNDMTVIGGYTMFGSSKASKLPISGLPGGMFPALTIEGAGKSDKMMGSSKSDKMFIGLPIPSGKADKLIHASVDSLDPAKMFPRPEVPDLSWLGAGNADKVVSSETDIPDGLVGSGKSDKIVSVSGSSYWGSDSKTSKLPSSEWNAVPTHSGDLYGKSDKYEMPEKRPPPPGLDEEHWIDPGWNRPPPPPYYWQHPYAKSAKSKAFKSGKAKSSKSKAGKSTYLSWGLGDWWGSQDDDYTYSPTYMPTQSDESWMGGEGSLNSGGEKPDQGSPPGGKPGYGNASSGKPLPARGPPPGQGGPFGGRPGNMMPNNNWWGGHQGGSSSWGSWGKPGNSWWGSDSAHHGSQLGSSWGNSWGSPWGNSWWGGWGGGWGGHVPIVPSMPSSKPTQQPAAEQTLKPTGLFPPENTEPSNPPNAIPTYSPSNPLPTYSPTSSGSTYAPTPSSATYVPTPTSSTYEPSPSTTAQAPSQPTEASVIPTTMSPTMTALDLCVWGSGDSSGQGEDDILVPVATGRVGVDASAGSKYSLIVEASGVAFASGYIEDMGNYHGHLGIPPEDLQTGINDFKEIYWQGNVTDPPQFEKVFAGVENKPGSSIIHSILLDNKGRAWATGSNHKGQLCLGDEIDRMTPELISLEGVRFVDAAIGGEHTLLLDELGNVYGCGSNVMGQLGLSSGTAKTDILLKLYTIPPAKSISSGRDHSLFFAEDGLYVTGDNSFGQLCVDTKGEPVSEPQALNIPVDIITSFDAIFTSSYILFSDGSVIACGNNNVGQLGNGEEKELVTFEPTIVETEFVVKILGVGPSSRSVFFASQEDVYGTGLNTNGQLGVGDTENRNLPTLVLFDNLLDIGLVSAGEDHTLALCSLGKAPLAHPTSYPTEGLSSYPTPVASEQTTSISTESNVTSIVPTFSPTATPSYLATNITETYSPTAAATYAPTEQGCSFFFWGNAESIGQKSEEDVIEPLMIEGDVLNTASGSRYSLIVLRDGSASSSGVVELFDGYRGHLGVDTAVTEGINPLQVISYIYDANATLLDAPAFDKAFAGVESTQGSGIIHSIFLDKMGNAYASGANTQGQLCLGDREDRFTPTLIPIEGPFIDVAIGGEYTILLHQDGSVFVCGSNEVGQIGLGDDISQTDYPVVLDFLPEVLAVSAGAEHSLFMSTDGIFVTGGNTYGQLCSNSTDFLTTPASLDIPIKDIVSFEATKYSSYILYVDGSVNACGKNDFGQLGDGSNDDKILTEVLVGNVVRLVGTGPASESVFFVGTDETMYASGLNERGNLGVGDTVNRAVPSRVKFGEHVFTDNISPAEDHTILCGLVLGTLPPTDAPSPAPTELITPSPTRQSVGFCFWGASESLGQGNEEDVTRPLYVEEAAVHASAGSRYTLIILQDGSALAGGFVESKDDYQGQFGLGGIVIGGSNDFKVISNVYGRNGTISDAPDFDMAFAGVEHPPESGVMHSVLLDRQGNAYATGSNSKGQLCLGDDEERLIPQQIPMEGRIIDVAIGGEHTLLLHENGTVYVCGSNEVGQIGLGEDVSQTSYPVLLEALSPISSVSAGVEHSLFMSEDGMFVTGDNSYGQLCIDNDGDALFEPGMLDISNSEVTSFEAIRTSTFILHSDGLVNACGRNDMGQLGDGTNETTVFTEVFLDEVEVVRLIGAGPSAESVFFVTKDEVAWGTGSNSRGNLGVGDLQDRNIPTKVRFPNEVLLSSFSAAEDHTVSLCLITGTVIPTVSPTFGATTRTPTFMPSLSPTIITEAPTSLPTVSPTYLKIETNTPTISPTYLSVAVPTPSPTYLEVVVTGTDTPTYLEVVVTGTDTPTYLSTVVTGSTELFSWGALESVGLDTDEITLPESLDVPVIDVSGGTEYSLILLEDGTAQSAGYIESIDNYHGHLGLKAGDVSEGSNSFRDISSSFDNDEIIDSPVFTRVFAGVSDGTGSIHSFLIDDKGQAWATGSNEFGELCLGDFDDRLIPTRVTLDGNIISVAIGEKHTLLLLDNGEVYACGSNEDGQLGLGEAPEETVSSPTKIQGLSDVRIISAGMSSSLFESTDGLYVAGNNFYGQLCIDTNKGSLYEPTLLEGVNAGDVASFEAISTSSYILFADGSVGACGNNKFGQLGDETNEDKFRVVVKPIPDDVPIRRLGVGPSSESVFFVNDDGLLYATGLNDRGQLGVGDTDNRNTLTLVEYSGDFVGNVQISAAIDHTLAR